MIPTMTITMDRAGRLVIPKEIREEADLKPGTPLDVRCRDGVIEIEPQAVPMKLVRRGRLLVARPTRNIPPLTKETVERTIRQLRERRGR